MQCIKQVKTNFNDLNLYWPLPFSLPDGSWASSSIQEFHWNHPPYDKVIAETKSLIKTLTHKHTPTYTPTHLHTSGGIVSTPRRRHKQEAKYSIFGLSSFVYTPCMESAFFCERGGDGSGTGAPSQMVLPPPNQMSWEFVLSMREFAPLKNLLCHTIFPLSSENLVTPQGTWYTIWTVIRITIVIWFI